MTEKSVPENHRRVGFRRSRSVRSIRPKPSAGWLLPLLVLIGLVTLGGVASALHGDVADVQVATRNDAAQDTVDGAVGAMGQTVDGTIVQYIGDLNTTFGASGTGTFNSFVRLQGNGTERGYNTDGPREFDTKGGMWTHSLLLSELPTVTIGGNTYWELWTDINESDATKPISLDEVELWVTEDPQLTGYDFGGSDAEPIYDWSGHVLINDVNQGSGRGDLRLLVPYDPTVVDDCTYGSPTCDTYVVLYSGWGGYEAGFASDGGFEEWKVREYPVLTITKTIDGTFEQDKTWDITKLDDGDYEQWIGQDVDHDFSVTVTPTMGDPYNHMVSGVITVVGDDDEDVVADIADVFEGEIADVDCGDGTGMVDISAGATVECDYTLALDDAVAGTNAATGTVDFDGVLLAFFGLADITVADYDATINGFDEVNVTDDVGTDDPGDDRSFGPVSVETTDDYTASYRCPTDKELYTNGSYELTVTNTAEIIETGDSDTATVTVTCWAIDVAKTAETSYDVDYDWTLTKEVSLDGGATWVDEAEIDVITGDEVDIHWRISADKGDPVDFNHAVEGIITVTNPAPMVAEGVVVSDMLSDGQTPVVDCGGDTNVVDVPANGAVDCTYSADLPDGSPLANAATAEFGSVSFTDVVEVSFDGVDPAVITDDTAILTDERLGLDIDLDDDWTSDPDAYGETVSCGPHVNVAALAPADSDAIDDDAQVTMNCLDPVVTKTVETALTRTYNWDLTKVALDADGVPIPNGEALTLAEGQTYNLTWEIVAALQDPAFSDSDWVVSGDITVSNPVAEPLDVTVADQLMLGGDTVDVVIDCGDGPGDTAATVPGAVGGVDGEVICSYLANPGNGDAGSNAATALYTAGGADYLVESAPVEVDFGSVATEVIEVDGTVDVYDLATNPPTLLGTLAAADAPATFNWFTMLGPDNLFCGLNEVVNGAKIVGDDGVELAFATDAVPVAVTCGDGCTLTPGYWSTHNPEFWAAHNGHGPPEDDAWYDLGDVDGDGEIEGAGELFPYGDTGKTYYQIMRTPPAGDPWYQLTFHYIAAELNVINGADPAVLGTALTDAEMVLDNHDPGKKGKKAKKLRALVRPLASMLAAYNEGEIGPGHCDQDGP